LFKNKHNKRINGKIYSALTCSQVGTSSYTELQENYSGVWGKKSFHLFFFFSKAIWFLFARTKYNKTTFRRVTFTNGKSLTILRIEIWQGQGPVLKSPRPSPKVSHFFFQRTRLITHSNHRELMQKTVGFYLVKASLHSFLMPAASTGISPLSSFYG
jgi:hypothetical protein